MIELTTVQTIEQVIRDYTNGKGSADDTILRIATILDTYNNMKWIK